MTDTKHQLTPETPRLAHLTGERHPFICQLCGGSNRAGLGNGLLRLAIDRWQECDHHDKPEFSVVVLCTKCSAQEIEKHPRLYHRLPHNQPWPGCMEICLNCKHRNGVRCGHPDNKANGGDGVLLSIQSPARGFVDGVHYRGPTVIWPSPASACKQKEEIERS